MCCFLLQKDPHLACVAAALDTLAARLVQRGRVAEVGAVAVAAAAVLFLAVGAARIRVHAALALDGVPFRPAPAQRGRRTRPGRRC